MTLTDKTEVTPEQVELALAELEVNYRTRSEASRKAYWAQTMTLTGKPKGTPQQLYEALAELTAKYEARSEAARKAFQAQRKRYQRLLDTLEGERDSAPFGSPNDTVEVSKEEGEEDG